MPIPDPPLCRRLMDRHSMLPNIVEHSFRVCQLARFLGRALARQACTLDPVLLTASSLLHDITKTRSLKTKEDHAETGAALLERLGYPEVAHVVRGHVRLPDGDVLDPLREVHILNYADKRVRHSEVVSLEERFRDLMARYGSTQERRRRLEQMRWTALDLEREIFARVDLRPEDLQAFNALDPFDLESEPPALAGRPLPPLP